MISSKALLKHLKKTSVDAALKINGNTYTLSQIKLAEQIINDLQQELTPTVKPKLSRRRAYIVILEERFYNVKTYPDNLTLDSIHRKAFFRFEFMNRDSRAFKTPNQVHPKNPCLYFEDNRHGMARYRSALKHLVNASDRYFQIPEAKVSIKEVYNEVLLC